MISKLLTHEKIEALFNLHFEYLTITEHKQDTIDTDVINLISSFDIYNQHQKLIYLNIDQYCFTSIRILNKLLTNYILHLRTHIPVLDTKSTLLRTEIDNLVNVLPKTFEGFKPHLNYLYNYTLKFNNCSNDSRILLFQFLTLIILVHETTGKNILQLYTNYINYVKQQITNN